MYVGPKAISLIRQGLSVTGTVSDNGRPHKVKSMCAPIGANELDDAFISVSFDAFAKGLETIHRHSQQR